MKFIAIFLLLLSSVCNAELPKRIELIVPYGPGGASDQAARHFQTWMNSKQHSVSIINKPGANGTIAMNFIMI